MRPVYALLVRIGDPGSDHAALFDGARGVVEDWIRGWHARRGAALSWPPVSGPLATDGSESGGVQVVDDLPGALRLFELRWRYHDATDASLEWETAIDLASSPVATEVRIHIGIRAASFKVMPVRFPIGTPRLLHDLARKYPCWVGDSPMTSVVRSFTSQGAPDFVRRLTDPDRTCALVLVSPTLDTDTPLVAPKTLAYELTGLAEVYTADKSALFSLSALVDSQFSCYDGAVRVYYPQVDLAASPYLHPLYQRREIDRQAASGRDAGPRGSRNGIARSIGAAD